MKVQIGDVKVVGNRRWQVILRSNMVITEGVLLRDLNYPSDELWLTEEQFLDNI